MQMKRKSETELHIPDSEESIYTRLMFLDLIHTEFLECPVEFR